MNIKKIISDIAGRVRLTGKIEYNLTDGTKGYRTYFWGKCLSKNMLPSKSNHPPFYLKVNRDAEYSLLCIQGWLDTAHAMDVEYCFVCDNKLLEYKIIKYCKFYDNKISFIPSIGKRIDGVVDNLCTKIWKKATNAHLTPFYKAKAMGVKQYWNIDADDTTIPLKPDNIAKVLRLAEREAENNDIAAFSLDMHRSKTFGRNWTLGVLFINDYVDFCHIFEAEKNLAWGNWILTDYDDNLNLDWYMSTLIKNNNVKIKSFYIENCFFIHWGNFMQNPIGCGIYYWKEKKLHFPLLKILFCNSRMGGYDVKDCVEISVVIDPTECIDYFRNKLVSEEYRQSRVFKDLCNGEQLWFEEIDKKFLNYWVN